MPFPSPRDLPNPGIEPSVSYKSPALAGRLFTTSATREVPLANGNAMHPHHTDTPLGRGPGAGGQLTFLGGSPEARHHVHSLFHQRDIPRRKVHPSSCFTDKYMDFPGGSDGKPSVYNAGDPGLIPEKGKIRWRRKWQSTPVLLPGKFYGQRSLVGYTVHGVTKSRTGQ